VYTQTFSKRAVEQPRITSPGEGPKEEEERQREKEEETKKSL
jgi:hypothetical protein